MKRSVLLSGLAVLLLAAAGCGGGGVGSDPGDDDDDGGSIDPGVAMQAGAAIAKSAEFGARDFAVRMSSGFVCDAVTSSGDTDGDGVPDYAAIQHTDCPRTTPWGPAAVSGDELITDNQPLVAGVDYSLAQDLTLTLTGGGSVSFEAAQVVQATGGTFQMDGASEIVHTGTDASGAFTRTEEIAWVKSYTPGSTWQPGDAPVAGTYAVEGAHQVTFESTAGSVLVQAAVDTVVPLSLDPACPTFIVAGSVQAVVGDGGSTQILSISWTGCDASGTELVPAP